MGRRKGGGVKTGLAAQARGSGAEGAGKKNEGRRRAGVRTRAAGERGRRGAAKRSGARPLAASSDHKSLWDGVKRRLASGLDNEDVRLGLEELKVAKMAGEVLSSVIRGERLAWSTEGEERVDHEGAGELASEMARATAPSGPGETLE